MSKNVLRRVLRDGNIEVPTTMSREQFFVDCMLEECSFTSTFGAFGDEYKAFVEEAEELVKVIGCDIDETQRDALHWATGVLPSSMLYYERASKLDKSLGDMIVDGLSRGIGYIDCYKDSKYSFLSDISNYSKEDVIRKITKSSENLLFVSALVDTILGGEDLSRGGKFSFRDTDENSISFGFYEFMASRDTVRIEYINDKEIKVERTIRKTPNDKYGRQLSDTTKVMYSSIVPKEKLEEVIIKLRLNQLKAF